MSFQKLREFLTMEASYEVWSNICDLFVDWNDGPIEAALDYAEQHLSSWNEDLRTETNIKGNRKLPAYWRLVRRIQYETKKERLPKVFQKPEMSVVKHMRFLEFKKVQDLSSLQGLTSLETLQIDYAESLQALDSLRFFPNLRKLSLHCIYSLPSLEGLEHCSELEELVLHNCGGLHDYSAISTLSKLSKLTIHEAENFESLEVFGSLPSLEELNLRYCRALNTTKGLSSLPSLRVLLLEHCGKLEFFEDGGAEQVLEKLSLDGCGELKSVLGLQEIRSAKNCSISGAYGLEDLSPLANLEGMSSLDTTAYLLERHFRHEPLLEGVKALSLDSATAWTGEGVEKVDISLQSSTLETLYIRSCDSKNLDFLVGLPGLKNLIIQGGGLLEDIKGLQHCPGLEHLSLEWRDMPNLEVLQSLKKLKEFHLYFSEKLVSLSGLEILEELEELALYSCRELRELTAIEGLTKLQKILIQSSEALRDVTGISKLPALEELDLHGNYSLSDIASLQELPKLRTLSLSFTPNLKDISPLGQFSALEEVELNCGGVETLDGLEKCLGLKRVTPTNCRSLRSIRALSELPLLSYVHLSGSINLDVPLETMFFNSRKVVVKAQESIRSFHQSSSKEE